MISAIEPESSFNSGSGLMPAKILTGLTGFG